MKNRILTFVALAICLVSSGCSRMESADYVTMLKALRGTSYWTLQCSTYITYAKHYNHHCGAGQFFKNGCDGALETVAVVPSFSKLDVNKLQPGDVIAFNAMHVAAYVGNGEIMDSDPVHGGVGDMTPHAIHGDLWFAGTVKVLRWKS